MEINNIDLILPLLEFKTDDDFYFLQILQRKKENDLLTSNSRVIKNYYIKSKEHLLLRYEEIKALCNLFNARASLRLNKRSFEKVGFKTLENLANVMQSRGYDHLPKSYDRACGQSNSESFKKWILDVDYKDCSRDEVIRALNFTTAYNIIVEIPSKSGLHIITNPFRMDLFKTYCNKIDLNIEVHKDNPTNLYIP